MAPVDSDSEDEGGREGYDKIGKWRDLMEKGKVRKRLLVAGSGVCAEPEQDVACTLEVRLASALDLPDEPPLQCRRRFRYRLGEKEAVPAIELALRGARLGDEFEVLASSAMAWGSAGCRAEGPSEKAVPPDADILFKVAVHELLPIISSDLSWNDKIQHVTWRKTNGNDHYKRKDHELAARCYQAGIDVFEGDFADGRNEAASAAAANLVVDCASNLAAVHLEKEDWAAAKEAATIALDRRADDVKANYRFAKACLELRDFKECQTALRKVQSLDPSNAGAKGMAAELRKAKEEYGAKSKRVAAGFLAGAHRPDALKTEGDAEEEEDDPTLMQEIIRDVMPSAPWRILKLAVACILVLIVGLYALPGEYFRYVVISVMIGAPLVAVGLTIADDRRAEGAEESEDKKTK